MYIHTSCSWEGRLHSQVEPWLLRLKEARAGRNWSLNGLAPAKFRPLLLWSCHRTQLPVTCVSLPTLTHTHVQTSTLTQDWNVHTHASSLTCTCSLSHPNSHTPIPKQLLPGLLMVFTCSFPSPWRVLCLSLAKEVRTDSPISCLACTWYLLPAGHYGNTKSRPLV